MPIISVILPVYNCEKYIFETVESVLLQTFVDFELLIIDDCSTDATISIIEEFDDARIQLIKKDKNTGYTDSLNYAISIARGFFIARMDGDDICLPKRFEKQVDFLEKNKNVIVCGTGIQIMGTDTLLHHPSNHGEIKVKLCFGSSFYHPTVMGRKEFFVKNPYDKNYEPAEDYDLWTRLAFQGELANLEEVLLLYRVHDKQVSNQKIVIQQENAFLIQLKILSHLEGIDQFSLDTIKLFLGIYKLNSFVDCEKIINFSFFLINSNLKLNVFDPIFFERYVKKRKITSIKSYITKSFFLKSTAYVFFIKNKSLDFFFEILDLKKRFKL
jgi:glycosyltransferase involved in cell wall biosynthesis